MGLPSVRGDLKKITSSFEKISLESWEIFANSCQCIQISKSADGRGLSTGADIDFFLTNQFLPEKMGSDFEKFHKGEADVKIAGIPASFKTLRTRGDLALSWSKNPTHKKDGSPSIDREFLENPLPMIVYVRESGRWWKNGPANPSSNSYIWNQKIRSGIYVADLSEASNYLTLKSNNKSDSIIDSKDMFRILVDAKRSGNFIEIPEPDGRFNKMSFVFE